MKKVLLIVIAALCLVGCGGDGGGVWCREVRFIHADGTYEYITVCDDRGDLDRDSPRTMADLIGDPDGR